MTGKRRIHPEVTHNFWQLRKFENLELMDNKTNQVKKECLHQTLVISCHHVGLMLCWSVSEFKGSRVHC